MCVRRHMWHLEWAVHVQRLSSNSPEYQTSNLFHSSHKWPSSDQTKSKPSFLLKTQKNLEYWYLFIMTGCPECSFNFLRAFTSSPWESLVCWWLLIGWSTHRLRFGWCRSRRAWCSEPNAVMGWAEWVKGEGSGSADLWRLIWATQSSGRRDQPPAWRQSWGRGPPAENRKQQIMSLRSILLCRR